MNTLMAIVPASPHGVVVAALCLLTACDAPTNATEEPGPASVSNVSAGSILTCGLSTGGLAYCWGAGGAIGDGTTSDRLTATAVSMPTGISFASVRAGGGHACALAAGGVPYCWGANDKGQLGDGTQETRLTPVAVTGPAVSFIGISGGVSHSCALASTGAAHCWGDNEFGQLGDGSVNARSTPTAVAAPSAVSFNDIDAGWIHSCGVTASGSAYCWGNNADGQLGDGTTTDRLSPTAVTLPAGVSFGTIAVGEIHTCALTAQGAAYCWGAAHRARLGDGTTVGRSTPGPVTMPSGATFTTIGVGYAHACGLTPSGAVFCWGRNVFGELGDGTTTDRPTPTAVAAPPGVTFTALAVGRGHTCALTPADAVYCWGTNLEGRVGDGTTINRLTPVQVVPR